jgi:hypothetical protein
MAATATTEKCRDLRVNMKSSPLCAVCGPRSVRNGPAANFGNAMFYMNDHSVRKGNQ